MSPVIGVDVDEVCADLLGEWLRLYNLDHEDTLRPEDIAGWDMAKQTKCGEGIYEYLYRPTLYNGVKPIRGALAAVKELRTLGRVVFVTSCPFSTVDQKYRWLIRHGFLAKGTAAARDFFPVKDKSLVAVDFLFDDNVDNVKGCRGKGVLVWHPHNRNQRGEVPTQVSSLYAAPPLVRAYLAAGL